MSSVYARFDFTAENFEKFKKLFPENEQRWIDNTAEPYTDDNGQECVSLPDEGGSHTLSDLEKAGYPIPCEGFRETDMMHASFQFVCPGDGSYHEIQVSEDGEPMVAVDFDEEINHLCMVKTSYDAAREYFAALTRYKNTLTVT